MICYKHVMRLAVAALDHLVLATADLDETAAWVADRTGIVPSPGGRHVGRGTRNMLCSLGATRYLEIIGPDPEQNDVDGPRPFGIDALDDARMVSWAVSVIDIDAAVESSREQGFDPGEVFAMQRQRPDGVLLSWRLTVSDSITTPFLIDWLDSPHPAPDAAPGLELAELRARHPDPSSLSLRLEALGLVMGVAYGPEALLVELRGPAGAIVFD